jgi:flagellar L-ring protein precursor FlgH
LKTDVLLRAAFLAAAIFPAASGTVEARQSLIDPATFRGPAADQHAHRVGDLLTVFVLETTTARAQAATGSDRGTDLSIDFSAPSTTYNAALGLKNKTKGSGETTRVGELRAQITVRVVAVEENGVLRISGSQSLIVNKEHQQITLSGLVRPEDISAANTVWSTRIADADVSLVGKGAVSEAQRRNVVSRVFQWLGLL